MLKIKKPKNQVLEIKQLQNQLLNIKKLQNQLLKIKQMKKHANVENQADEEANVDSEDDDFADDDYLRPEDVTSDENDVHSDVSSEELDDIEGSSDDDIFVDRQFTKQDLLRNLRRMGKNARKPSKRLHKCPIDQSESQWYNEAEDDDAVDNLDGCNKSKCPTFTEGQNMKNRELEVLMKFGNIGLFRQALTDWLVRNGYELEYVKNERKRVTAECKTEGCNWRIHASVVQGGPTFQIKSITGEHTCSKKRVNKHATSKYIGHRIEQAIKDNPDVTITNLGNSVMRKLGIEAGYWKTLRAKNVTINKVRGLDAEEYTQLWDYCETVRSKNPGAKLLLRKVLYSDPPVFERMYFSLPAMRMGFLSGCRPLIGLDGCFLKTVHGGQLLCAVGRDGNDNLFPIALAVVPVENREAWTWFLGELLDEIGGVAERKWTFISDRQKGLLEAIKDIAPECAHRFCVRHIYQNFKQKWPSLELKSMLWRAASTGNNNEFESKMVEIRRLDKDASEYLRKIPAEHWAISYFSTKCRSDVLVNNLCESFNNYILEAREKPIISMFEWIRTRLTTRIQTKKAGMEKYAGTICPNILRKINKSQQLARNCYPRWCGNEEFEVDANGVRYVVDLAKRECTCGIFQLNGYPCPHAWSCIAERRYKVEDFVDTCYRKENYLKVYAYMTHTCQNCLQRGHNKGTCKNPTNPRSKLYKGNSPSEGVQTSQSAPPSSSQEPVTPHPTGPSYAANAPPGSLPPHPSGPPSGPLGSVPVPGSGPHSVPPRHDPAHASAPPGRIYQGRRNEALLGRTKQFKKPRPTNQAQATVPPLSQAQATVPPPNQAQATVPPPTAKTVPLSTSNATFQAGNSSQIHVRKRKPQIAEVLQNIRNASKKKRHWKP